MSSHPELKLDWCSHDAAMFAAKHWHYSKTLQAGKCAKVGVWENGKFIGTVVFSAGSGSTTAWAVRVGLQREEMAELARVALAKHETPVSRIIAIAIRLLKKQSPNLKLLVSYADPREGHHGGIYQAGGWVYVGETAQGVRYIDKHGREHHPRMVSSSGVKISFGTNKNVAKSSDCQKVTVPGKHKYLFPLSADVAKRIYPLAKPYPKKRVASDTIDTSAVHAEKGSETLTATLQRS